MRWLRPPRGSSSRAAGAALARTTGLGAAVVVLLVAAQPALACDASGHLNAKRGAAGRAPLAVGDSVLLGALRQVAAAGFEVDARGCRQMRQGVALLRARRASGTLPRLVVMSLGANWVIGWADLRAALRTLGPDRVLGLLTPRESGGGAGADAALVRAAGRRWPERVLVLDWVRVSAGRSSWFGGDGLHLGPAGAAAMARLHRRALPWSVDCRGRALRRRPPAVAATAEAPLLVADSLLRGAGWAALQAGFEIDARGCRRMGEALRALRSRRLPAVVALALGTDWGVRLGDLRAALDALGPRRRLVLVTPRERRGSTGADAAVLRAAGRRWPGRVAVFDWAAASAGRRRWFAADGVHLTRSGARAFAGLLGRALPGGDEARGAPSGGAGPSRLSAGSARAAAPG